MIYDVGCNHGIQPRDGDWLAGDTPEAREQKTRFAELLDETIQRCEIRCAGEEWGREEITILHAIADTHQIPWANINTSHEELDRLLIPRNYTTGPFNEVQKRNWHRQREQIMLGNLRRHAGEVENILLVCGFEHMDPIAVLLREQNVAVTVVDYRTTAWYRPGVFCEDL
jgi:hypothetical protein